MTMSSNMSVDLTSVLDYLRSSIKSDIAELLNQFLIDLNLTLKQHINDTQPPVNCVGQTAAAAAYHPEHSCVLLADGATNNGNLLSRNECLNRCISASLLPLRQHGSAATEEQCAINSEMSNISDASEEEEEVVLNKEVHGEGSAAAIKDVISAHSNGLFISLIHENGELIDEDNNEEVEDEVGIDGFKTITSDGDAVVEADDDEVDVASQVADQLAACVAATTASAPLSSGEVVHAAGAAATCSNNGNNNVLRGLNAGRAIYCCSKCNLVFGNKRMLNAHRRTHLITSYAAMHRHGYGCRYCPKILANSESLRRHEAAVHLDNKPFRCNACERTFQWQYQLRRHEVKVHQATVASGGQIVLHLPKSEA